MRTMLRMLTLSAALVTLASGCDFETVPQAIFVQGNAIPDQNCTVRAQGGSAQAFRFKGVLDVSIGSRYSAYMFVRNSFPNIEEVGGYQTEDARLEGGVVTIDSLEVTYRINSTVLTQDAVINRLVELGLPATNPITLTLPAVGTIEPNTASVVIADIVPSGLGLVFRQIQELQDGGSVEIVADVVLQGYRADRTRIRSDPWPYPITLCNNCLVQPLYDTELASRPFTSSAVDPEDLLEPADAIPEDLCIPGADQSVSNAYCGALFGPDSPGDDSCALQRCLGEAGAPLVCGNDSATVLPPPPSTN